MLQAIKRSLRHIRSAYLSKYVQYLLKYNINSLELTWWCWLGIMECAPPQGFMFDIWREFNLIDPLLR